MKGHVSIETKVEHLFIDVNCCRYRRKREKLVERTVVCRLPTKWGQFEAYCYRSKLDGTEYMAILKVMESNLN